MIFWKRIGANSSTVIPLNLLCMLKHVTSGVKKVQLQYVLYKMNNVFM